MSNCNYIKDNGEQCGIECGDDEYCHIHSDSDDTDAARRGFTPDELPTVCSECDAAVKVTGVSLDSVSPNDAVVSKKLVVACLCSATKLNFTEATEYKAALPDEWL